jgi:hypothetical protein
MVAVDGVPSSGYDGERRHTLMAHDEDQRRQGVSPELDELSSTLMGDAFDMLAEGKDISVLLVVEDAAGGVAPYVFSDDGPEECLEGARAKVCSLDREGGDPDAQLGAPMRYALTYEGAVEGEGGAYRDALILEFGERGYTSYSAYSFIEGKGRHDKFRWSDPAPAGEMKSLL